MNEVLRLQKHLMRFTVECFKQIPEVDQSLIFDSKGNKIKVPSFLDDDELFMDDEDEKFSSLQPSNAKCSSIPSCNVEH